MNAIARWAGLVLATLAIAGAGWWWVTAGDFRSLATTGFAGVFDAQARSYREGHLDIACQVASGEAFRVGDRCYTYFGPVPALLRLPFSEGTLSGWMVLLANLLMLAFVLCLLAEAGYPPGSWIATGYLLLAAFGTTVPYMWAWPTAYTEALSWAVAFGVGALWCLIRHSRARQNRWLVAAALLAMLSFFSRVTTGAGPMLAVGVISIQLWMQPRNRKAAGLTLGLLAAAALAFAGFNHARFGTYLNSVPIHLHVQYDAQRLERIGGTLFHPIDAPPLFLEYLVYPPQFRASYPWVQHRPGTVVPLDRMDMTEPHTGVIPLMPALMFLAWGAWKSGLKRRSRWILASPLLGLSLLSTVAAINHRYLHEFTLLLIPAGVFGLGWVAATRARLAVVLILAGWSCYANWALALLGQREGLPWVEDEALDRHRATRYRVDRWTGVEPPGVVEFNYIRGGAPPPVEGVVVRLSPGGAVYRFEGGRWRHVSGPLAHRYRLRLDPGKLPEQNRLNLLTAGEPPEIDTIALDRSGLGRYRIVMDHFGTITGFSPEVSLEAGRAYTFEIDFDRLNREIKVSIDGRLAGSRQTRLAIWIEQRVQAVYPAVLVP